MGQNMAVSAYTYIPNRVIDANGISDGASIYFYLTGTTTLQSIWQDAARTTPRANPVVVAAGAPVPSVYLNPAITYRVVTKNSAGVTIEGGDVDPFVGFPASGVSTTSGDTVQEALDAVAGIGSALSVNTTTPFVSIAGTRTSSAPRIKSVSGTDIGFDAFIVSNSVARGASLFRDEFQDVSDFQSAAGAHASFDAFTQFGGSANMNHARGFQARMKINMTSTSNLSEWTGHFVQPIFNGTFNINQAQAFWVRDCQIDSGTQNLFAAYGLLVDNCPNWGANFKPIVSFDAGTSYLAGGIEFANTADIFGVREVRANAVHAGGGIASYNAGGGVMINYTGGEGYIRSYSDAGGTGDKLTINPVGGQVVIGNGVIGNSGTVMDVTGFLSATGYFVGANQVVGARGAAVANGVNAAAAPTNAEFNALVTQFNALLARVRAHGLIAP